MKIFSHLFNFKLRRAPLAWRADLARLSESLINRSSITLEGYNARETVDGLDFARSTSAATAFRVREVESGIYTVGPGAVRIAGKAEAFVLSSSRIAGGARGFICVQSSIRQIVATGSYALGYDNGFINAGECADDPTLAFVALGATPNPCVPDLTVPECAFGTVNIPIAFVDASASRVVQLVARGIVIGFGSGITDFSFVET